MAELAIEALGKSFGRHEVLRDVSLRVESGSLLAVLGVSGGGKTTLLRLIAGFEAVDRGSIAIDGAVVAALGRHVPPERRRIGYVPQNGALFPHLTVAENIGFGLPARAREAAVARLLERGGLDPALAGRMPAQLSGGQQQRVALARALAPNPRLVLLDEPFSALDPALRAETAAAVVAALRASGSTAILVTHDRGEAFSLGSGVAVLREGRIAQTGSPEALYRRPVDLDLALFLGEGTVLPGLAAGGMVRCALGELAVAEGGPVGAVDVLVRPEQIRLAAEGAVRGRVVDVAYFGADASVTLALPAGPAVMARILGQALPRPGEVVSVCIEGMVAVFAAAGDEGGHE